jgi:ferritin-like metal-binding protein YciE
MQLLKPEFNNLEDLFWDQVKDIYDAEQRLTDALPKLADAAFDPALKNAFSEHLQQTRQHVQRLEQIFRSAGKEPERESCDGIKGLLKEGDEMIGARGRPERPRRRADRRRAARRALRDGGLRDDPQLRRVARP